MSNLKLNSAGGGSVTLSVPSTSSARTLTLPDLTDTVAVTNQLGLRNRIINGAMMIDQRNAGASVTVTSSSYTLDRWQATITAASKYSVQRNAGAVTPPVGFTNYLGVTSLSAYSISSGDYYALRQFIEGYNIADLAWGTTNAQPVTLSFRVYSSLTGVFGGCVRNGAGDRAYPFIYTISSANTWTTISIIVPGDTTGAWVTDNTAGIQILFGLGVGSTYSGTAGAWAAGAYLSATGATSVVGTNGATFYITGVQLEKGATATPFENRLYGTELALCQRYYEIGSAYLSAYTSLAANYPIGMLTGTNFQNTKRSSPTISVSTTASSNIYTNIRNTGNINTASFSSVGLVSTQNAFGNITITWTASAEL